MTEMWDVFISHASEDKDAIARPLAEALQKRGFRVWYDEFTLKLGDSLRRTIDRGLRESTYGIVILSKAFFAKEWPQKELDGLFTREKDGKKVILPIWHHLTKEEVETHSPMLAGKLAAKTENGLESVVKDIIEVIGTSLHPPAVETSESLVVSQLIRKLRDGSDSERNRAARKLQEFNLPQVVDALLDTAKHDKQVRYEALLALYELRSEKARGIFIERLEDPSPKIRHISILALGEIGEPATIEPLQKIIDTDDFNFLNKKRRDGKGKRTNWGKSENVVIAKNAILSLQKKFGITKPIDPNQSTQNTNQGTYKKPDIRPEISYGFISEWEGKRGVESYLISAKNFDNKPVFLSSFYIPLPNDYKLYHKSIPGLITSPLNPNDRFDFPWPVSDLNERLHAYNMKEFQIIFTDKLDNKYISEPFQIIEKQ